MGNYNKTYNETCALFFVALSISYKNCLVKISFNIS